MSDLDREEDDSSGNESQTLPEGKRIPFNSRRLPAAYLKQVGEALRLPTGGSREELRQLVEGKLATKRGVEVSSVQVVAHEAHQIATKLWLVDSEGVVLETTTTKEVDTPDEIEQAGEAEELQRLREELAASAQETDRLREALAAQRSKDTSAHTAQVAKLQEALAAEKKRAKEQWKWSCSQVSELDALVASKDG